MDALKTICVFCGSSPGRRPEYAAAARALGGLMARRGITLVYGGGRIGLMGILADAALDGGGRVIGVIPHSLEQRELAHPGLTELRVTNSMHERKALMADLAEGFIALPGGIGTFEEFLEILTWAQLGIHAKPCGMLNVAGYFDPLVALLDRAVAERFLLPAHHTMMLLGADPATLLEKMLHYQPPSVEKWIDREES